MYRFEEYVEQTQQATTIEELKRLYSEAIKGKGYENFLLSSLRGREVYHLHWLEFPDGYPEHYFDQRWEQIDPVLECSLRARRPFLWNDVFENTKLTKRQITFVNECRNHGVHSGLAFPLHGPGNQLDVVSISRRAAGPANPECYSLLHSMTVQTWTRFLELTEVDRFPKLEDILLTSRELEVLKWCKDGKSYSEIAEILSVSRKTVEFHIGNAMDKLGANNKISAVVIAIQRGLLDL